MDFIFISMPYSRFISRWFSNVPNINLGTVQALLTDQGKQVKTFHFHLEFLPYLRSTRREIWEKFVAQSEQAGVEYMGLDYVFASLLFEEEYTKSKELFTERIESIGLTINEFEEMRMLAQSFIDISFAKLIPYLPECKLVGFSSSHYQLSSSLMLCSMIKKQYPDISTILGGKDCTGLFAGELMKHFESIDFIGTGECERALCEALDYLDGTVREPSNVLYRDTLGKIVRSPEKPNYSVNSLPLPRFEFEEFPLIYGDIILPIEFGRGCPWKQCTFCPDESYNIKCQVKTADRLWEEIQYYQHISTDLKTFFILDSDALKNPDVVVDLSRHLEGKGITFQYAEFRAEKMSRRVLGALLHFGTWASNFQIGIETFSERVLGLMNKGVSVLKNVEVLKAVAELHVPVQFNLFTCYPKMTADDMFENVQIMDMISHILVKENIQIFPGEFYLPPDCAVFLQSEQYGISKNDTSIFSSIFERFELPSYSNYPYPYLFENDEEQFHFSQLLRNAVEAIKRENPRNNFMILNELTETEAEVLVSRKGNTRTYKLNSHEKQIYILAMKQIQNVDDAVHVLQIPADEVTAILQNLFDKKLVLTSSDKKSYLSLAFMDNSTRTI